MLEEFEKHLTGLKYSPETVRGYLSDIRNCMKHNILDNNLNLKNCNLLLELGLSAASIHRYAASIKKLFKFMKKSDPLAYMQLPRIKNKLPKIVDKKDIFSLLSSELPPEIIAMISIIYSTGCRVSSLISLGVSDIKENEIIFYVAKGDKPYISVLTGDTKKAIEKYMETTKYPNRKNGYLFCKKNKNKLSTSALRMRLKRAMGKNYISPHIFRHSIATELISCGAELLIVSDFLNHKSVNTTQRYIHLSMETKRKKLEMHHPMLC